MCWTNLKGLKKTVVTVGSGLTAQEADEDSHGGDGTICEVNHYWVGGAISGRTG